MLLSVLIPLVFCLTFVAWDADEDFILPFSIVSTILFTLISLFASAATSSTITFILFIQTLALWLFCLFVLPKWMFAIKAHFKDTMKERKSFRQQKQVLLLDQERIKRDKLNLEYQKALKEISA
jgi:hypothetical protein